MSMQVCWLQHYQLLLKEKSGYGQIFPKYNTLRRLHCNYPNLMDTNDILELSFVECQPV